MSSISTQITFRSPDQLPPLLRIAGRWVPLPSVIAGALAVLAFLLLPGRAVAADQPHLAIFAPQINYLVNVQFRDGSEYVGLLDVLDPLGQVATHINGKKWTLDFGSSSGQIEILCQEGKKKCTVRGVDVAMAAKFVVSEGHGYVPLSALAEILTHVTNLAANLNVRGRRLLLGTNGVHFSSEVLKNPSRLVLTFPSPVNPAVTNEGNTLLLTFTREPVTTSGPETTNFGDPLITSGRFMVVNGAALYLVTATAPVVTMFSQGNRVVTISAPPPAAAPTPAPAQPPAKPPAQAQPTPAPVQPAPQKPAAPTFIVAIDAAHGGTETGALLSPTLAEKDVTLALARRIARELQSKGMGVYMVRTGDTQMTLDQRASAANTAHAALYIAIHATAQGHGVRLYTALLPPSTAVATHHNFVPWETAQSAWLDLSATAAGSIADECNRRNIPVRAMPAAVRPLNNIEGPAIALEIAPPSDTLEDINSATYQQSIASAVAAGITAIRPKLEAAR